MRWLIAPAALVLLVLGGFLAWKGLGGRGREVVVYVSADQELAAPVLEAFSVRTGIRVLPVYDTEATKTAGLAVRLLAERGRPVADVFWASEPLRMARLAREGVLEPYDSPDAEGLPAWARRGAWTAFSSRTRVILTRNDASPEPLRRLEDLADPKWKGRIGIADPRFGTTSTQAAALGAWGLDWAARLRANSVRVLSGNAVVRELVERGELAAGLMDSDDALVALDRGLPARSVVAEPVLAIPNAVGLVKGGPHPAEGRLLLDFLVSAETETALARHPVRQPPLRGSPAGAEPPDWDALGAEVESRAEAFFRALTSP